MIHLAVSSSSFLIPLVISLPLVVFWAWMFRHMINNDNLPGLLSNGTLTGDIKSDWTLAFIILSLFTAILYYLNVYRNRR